MLMEKLYLACLNEVFNAGGVVLHTGKMQSGPSVVVAHVHVNTSQVGSLQGHLVALELEVLLSFKSDIWVWDQSTVKPGMQRTRAGQASDFAPRSFALSGSSCRWCALQSGKGM